ncbi:oxygenase MpaB family protein [Sporichthya sp.]|uniref:oxygenase MpaB family protein n=1 Tax=Sporichthya sp. TaxID=65475 RepID=UPI0025DB372F|nr:oxygenase MpaB family protein [Sporichthya sp.]
MSRIRPATSAGANSFPGSASRGYHPAIGTVVDQRSAYRTDPWGRAERSFASVQTWIYGGREHHALAAEPWAWVPLTAYHALVSYSRYFMPRPLTERQLEQGYQEILEMCRILQVSERMLPPTTTAYWAYYEDMIDRVLENQSAHTVIAVAERTPPLPTLPGPLLRSAGAIAGRLNAALPERVAYMRIAREARRAARGATHDLDRTLAARPM